MENTFALEKEKYLNELNNNMIMSGLIEMFDFVKKHQIKASIIAKLYSMKLENQEDNLFHQTSVFEKNFLRFISNIKNISLLNRKVKIIKNPKNLKEIQIARNYCMFFEDLFFILMSRYLQTDERGIDGYKPFEKEENLFMYTFIKEFIDVRLNGVHKEYEKLDQKYLNEVNDMFSKSKEEIEVFIEKLASYEEIEYYRYNYLEVLLDREYSNNHMYKELGYYSFRNDCFYPALLSFDDIFFVFPIEKILTCWDDNVINYISPKFHEQFIIKREAKKIETKTDEDEKREAKKENVYSAMQFMIKEFEKNFIKDYSKQSGLSRVRRNK